MTDLSFVPAGLTDNQMRLMRDIYLADTIPGGSRLRTVNYLAAQKIERLDNEVQRLRQAITAAIEGNFDGRISIEEFLGEALHGTEEASR